MAGFVTWLGIAISHYRFRRAYIAQGGNMNDLPYRAKLFPFGPLLALALCTFIILGQNFQAFIGGEIDWNGVFVSYIGLPLFLIVWLVYKVKHKTKLIPLKDCDFDNK